MEGVAEDALRGASADEIVTRLVGEGLDRDRARAEVDGVMRSPILAVAHRMLTRSAAVEQSARLQRALDPAPVAERRSVDEHVLYREHWTAHRPLVLRGAAASWPAAQWTWSELRSRFAWAPVDVSVREAGWTNHPRQNRRMMFGDLVDIALGPPSDHLYADGRTNLLNQAGMVPLRADLGLLPGLVGDGNPRAWVGPAGTTTPTHHDQSTAWQVLLLGRKRLYLASPMEASVADSAVGLFNTLDPRSPATPTDAARWHRVELEPGDAVFVPVGWWHHVEALEPSFSVSFSGFRWPNRFPWYLPGRSQAMAG